MRAQESVGVKNVAAGTYPVAVIGGLYTIAVIATGFGSIDVQRFGPDGSSLLSVLGAPFTANGGQTVYLAPGLYDIVIATSTANYVEITRIPVE